MDISNYLKGNTAVFIDAANLEHSAVTLNFHIDYRKLKELFNPSTLKYLYIYTVRHGTKNQENFFSFLKRAGYKLVTKPLKIIKNEDDEDTRKANFDVEISVDIIDLIADFDTCILFSGDSDFDYLIKKLRKVGKTTLVISTKKHISRELIQSSNKYIDLKKLQEYIEREDYKKRPSLG